MPILPEADQNLWHGCLPLLSGNWLTGALLLWMPRHCRLLEESARLGGQSGRHSIQSHLFKIKTSGSPLGISQRQENQLPHHLSQILYPQTKTFCKRATQFDPMATGISLETPDGEVGLVQIGQTRQIHSVEKISRLPFLKAWCSLVRLFHRYYEVSDFYPFHKLQCQSWDGGIASVLQKNTANSTSKWSPP